MNEIKIEKGIPVPAKKRVGNRWAHGAKWAQTFRNMEIGDSFLAPANRLPVIFITSKRNGWKIRTQTQPHVTGQKIATVRIWLAGTSPVAPAQTSVTETNLTGCGPVAAPLSLIKEIL